MLILQISTSNAVILMSNEGGLAAMSSGDGLRMGFYNSTCPRAEEIVYRSLRRAFQLDPTAPPSLIRLVFHDCQVQVLHHHSCIIIWQIHSSMQYPECKQYRSLDWIDPLCAAGL